MLKRTHQKDDAASVAIYSDCERYRYSLTRVWDETGGTVERCERRARALGYGAFRVTNIFAWRDTDPKKMRAARDPIGPANDAAILDACDWADVTVAAWGTHGEHLNRGAAIKSLLQNMDIPFFHLGLSKAGHPKHPLYISYAQQPVLWSDLNG